MVSFENSLAWRFPTVAAEWHPTRNSVQPWQVAGRAGSKAWWLCRRCWWEWEAVVGSRTDRTRGRGCPACSGNSKFTPYTKSLAYLYPEVAADWHPTRNSVQPWGVAGSSHNKAWWLCRRCWWEWEAEVGSRTDRRGRGCPACSGNSKFTPYPKSLAYLYPEVAAEWHPTRNSVQPWQVAGRSGTKAWWLCRSCGLEWGAGVRHRTDGCGCPHCSFGGFDPYKSGYLYLCYLPKDSIWWLKIGITNGWRLGSWEDHGARWIAVWLYHQNGFAARGAEQEVLAQWEQADYPSLGALRNDQEASGHSDNDGYTESVRLEDIYQDCEKRSDNTKGCRHQQNHPSEQDHPLVCDWLVKKVNDIATCYGGQLQEDKSQELLAVVGDIGAQDTAPLGNAGSSDSGGVCPSSDDD